VPPESVTFSSRGKRQERAANGKPPGDPVGALPLPGYPCGYLRIPADTCGYVDEPLIPDTLRCPN
jgi:hypothetical protein